MPNNKKNWGRRYTVDRTRHEFTGIEVMVKTLRILQDKREEVEGQAYYLAATLDSIEATLDGACTRRQIKRALNTLESKQTVRKQSAKGTVYYSYVDDARYAPVPRLDQRDVSLDEKWGVPDESSE